MTIVLINLKSLTQSSNTRRIITLFILMKLFDQLPDNNIQGNKQLHQVLMVERVNKYITLQNENIKTQYTTLYVDVARDNFLFQFTLKI